MVGNQTRSLGDVAEIVMGQSPSGDSCNHDSIGLPLLNGPTEFGTHHPFPTQFTTDARKLSKPGDILFCVRGSTTGRMNWSDQIYAIGRGIAAIRHRNNRGLQPLVRAVIEYDLPRLLQAATGSTFPNVSAAQLAGVTFPLLTPEEEIAVSSLLGTFDDKSDLNRRMGETLEAIIRAIFQDWFIDFGPTRAKMEGRAPYLAPELWSLFPDQLADDGRPEGWQIGRLADIAEITMGISPDGSTYNEEGNGMPLVNGPVEYGNFFLRRIKWTTAPNKVSRRGDLIICVRGSTTGRHSFADGEYCLGRGVAAIRSRNDQQEFVDASVLGHIDRLLQRTTGSVFPSLSSDDFRSFEILVPSDPVREAYCKAVRPMREQVWANLEQSDTLGSLRDLLLPKLMSGEIRVKDAARIAEAAAL
jgi:type I restriction enzyme S subunit